MLNATEVAASANARGEQREGGASALAELHRVPGNGVCADCGAGSPEWASINLGVLVCIQCSGFHRAMGVHVCKVRSFQLDAWSETELAVMRRLGNSRVNAVLAARLPAASALTATAPGPERELFVSAKYAARQWLREQQQVLGRGSGKERSHKQRRACRQMRCCWRPWLGCLRPNPW